ncbi:hypothetical protein EDD11_003579 [Mortierella claussenii]|nr:hypothetical protein EDD11_003579 [Mortierella claussenii]
MGKFLNKIEPDQQKWMEKQKLFFVASAPLDAEGTINSSPKGYDCLRVVNPNQVCYLELTGSGIETQSHIEENGRLTLMFLAFEGAPKILRLFGRGHVCRVDTLDFKTLYNAHFQDSELQDTRGIRAIITIQVEKVGISCGFGVPYYEYKGNRPTLKNYWNKRSEEQIMEYWSKENAYSQDGLPGMRHERMRPVVTDIAKSTTSSSTSWRRMWIEQQPALAFGSTLAGAFIVGMGVAAIFLRK